MSSGGPVVADEMTAKRTECQAFVSQGAVRAGKPARSAGCTGRAATTWWLLRGGGAHAPDAQAVTPAKIGSTARLRVAIFVGRVPHAAGGGTDGGMARRQGKKKRCQKKRCQEKVSVYRSINFARAAPSTSLSPDVSSAPSF